MGLERDLILDELLKVEENEKLFSYTFTKNRIPIWFYTRNGLFKEVIISEHMLSEAKVTSRINYFGLIKYLWKTVSKNPFFAPRKDIYIFGSDIVNVLEDKKYVNRLYDYFFDLMPNRIQIFESSTNKKYVHPKKNIFIKYSDFLEVFVFIFSKFIVVSRRDKKEIREMIAFLKDNLAYEVLDDNYFSKLENTLFIIASRVTVSSFIYGLFFKLKKPKLFILEDASYGMSAHILLMAKKLNIKTAEYQHGYVGLAHRAYNHNLKHKKNAKYFPDYFLTYGNYWSQNCRLFSKTVSIGSPFLEKSIEKYKNNKTDENIILFLSCGLTPDRIIEMILNLKKDNDFNHYKLLFRPHPTEQEYLKERYGSLDNVGIEIDKGNLYDILSLADNIVSDGPTTVLYEAVFFSKKIHIMNNSISDLYGANSLFLAFKDASNLKKDILEGKEIEKDKNYFWDKNWKLNYENFINEVLESE